MRNYKYDYLVFIGRFEPPHIGHIEVIKHALSLAQFVVVLVGSANQPSTALLIIVIHL
jgi:bifunctional NMN adenylyltransferase/nudix hydrolase